MNPINFKQMTVTLAKDQPQYRPLPCFQNDRETISRWKFTWLERLRVLFSGRMWLRQYNLGDPLQPQLPTLKYPFIK
jgi:hypothetical protein